MADPALFDLVSGYASGYGGKSDFGSNFARALGAYGPASANVRKQSIYEQQALIDQMRLQMELGTYANEQDDRARKLEAEKNKELKQRAYRENFSQGLQDDLLYQLQPEAMQLGDVRAFEDRTPQEEYQGRLDESAQAMRLMDIEDRRGGVTAESQAAENKIQRVMESQNVSRAKAISMIEGFQQLTRDQLSGQAAVYDESTNQLTNIYPQAQEYPSLRERALPPSPDQLTTEDLSSEYGALPTVSRFFRNKIAGQLDDRAVDTFAEEVNTELALLREDYVGAFRQAGDSQVSNIERKELLEAFPTARVLNSPAAALSSFGRVRTRLERQYEENARVASNQNMSVAIRQDAEKLNAQIVNLWSKLPSDADMDELQWATQAEQAQAAGQPIPPSPMEQQAAAAVQAGQAQMAPQAEQGLSAADLLVGPSTGLELPQAPQPAPQPAPAPQGSPPAAAAPQPAPGIPQPSAPVPVPATPAPQAPVNSRRQARTGRGREASAPGPETGLLGMIGQGAYSLDESLAGLTPDPRSRTFLSGVGDYLTGGQPAPALVAAQAEPTAPGVPIPQMRPMQGTLGAAAESRAAPAEPTTAPGGDIPEETLQAQAEAMDIPWEDVLYTAETRGLRPVDVLDALLAKEGIGAR